MESTRLLRRCAGGGTSVDRLPLDDCRDDHTLPPAGAAGRSAIQVAATATACNVLPASSLASAPLLLLLLLLLSLPSPPLALSGVAAAAASDNRAEAPSDYDALAADIRAAISSHTVPDEDGKPFYALVPAFVRLAFSSCLGGRCDGCVVQPPRGVNSSVAAAVDALEKVRRGSGGGRRVSRADLWAIAAAEAINFGIRRANEVKGTSHPAANMLLRFGRRDCSGAPYAAAQRAAAAPNPLMGVDGVLAFFKSAFSLSERHAVALMGAHAVGALRRRDSGAAVANWVNCADCFDNSYFRDLDDSRLAWQQKPVRLDNDDGGELYVWRHGSDGGKRFMFNCDMSLVLNFSVADAAIGRAESCRRGSCPSSDTARWVRRYARHRDAWMADFVAAFLRVLERGYRPGELTEGMRFGGGETGSDETGSDKAGGGAEDDKNGGYGDYGGHGATSNRFGAATPGRSNW